ncbi:hypothetical protein F4811DRAFT_567960 [Daldinia bambusicola]|nr:hypothetical protein F4811DRAFT_567960 [Daldinia bambusicola]
MATSSDMTMAGSKDSAPTGNARDASTQTGVVHESNPSARGVVNPPLLSSLVPVPLEIRETIINSELIVELLGCGTDFKGRTRPPFRSIRRVAPASVDIMVPTRGTTIIFPDEANIAIVTRGLDYLLDQKFNAYGNHRTKLRFFPYYAFKRKLAEYETQKLTEMVKKAAPPQEKVLRLFRVNRRDEWVPVPEGGKLVFVRPRRDGWTYCYDPVAQGPVDTVLKNDICLWECEEAISLLYKWLQELNAGAFPFKDDPTVQ